MFLSDGLLSILLVLLAGSRAPGYAASAPVEGFHLSRQHIVTGGLLDEVSYDQESWAIRSSQVPSRYVCWTDVCFCALPLRALEE